MFTGFRISAGLSVIGAVVGDFFFRQGDPGIGQLIDRYRASNSYAQMYGAVILAAALGIAVFWLFGWIGNRAIGHWHETARRSQPAAPARQSDQRQQGACMVKHRKRALWAVPLALAVLATACGGDDGECGHLDDGRYGDDHDGRRRAPMTR